MHFVSKILRLFMYTCARNCYSLLRSPNMESRYPPPDSCLINSVEIRAIPSPTRSPNLVLRGFLNLRLISFAAHFLKARTTFIYACTMRAIDFPY